VLADAFDYHADQLARPRDCTVLALSSGMPDERAESISQGIAAPDESRIGKEAEKRLEQELVNTPENARPDGAMGGTSDVDAPVDDAEMLRARHDKD
jgi:hypothetical protein